MDQGQRIIKNSFFVTGSQALIKLIALISVPIIARSLGTQGFGKYTLAYSFVMLASGISDLGMDNLTIRDIARDKSLINKFLSNSLILRFLLNILVYLFIILVAKLLGYPKEVFFLISILSLVIFPNFLINIFNSIVIALERMGISSFILFIQYLITPATVVGMLYLKYNLETIFVVMVFANLFLSVIYTVLINKLFIHLKWNLDIRFWKYLIKNSIPFAILNILWLVYIQGGIIILAKIQGFDAVGIYNAAYKLILALLFIPSSIILVFFPLISRQSIEKLKYNLKKSCENTLRTLFLISFPLALGTSFFSDSIVNLLYGDSFIKASPILIILIWTMFFMFINSPLSLAIINSKFLKKFVFLITFIVLLSILLNIIFIMKLNAIGGALSLIITEVIKLITFYIFIKRYLNFRVAFFKILKKPLFLGIAVGFLIYLLKISSVSLFITILLSIVFYLFLLIISKEYILEKLLNFRKLAKNNS